MNHFFLIIFKVKSCKDQNSFDLALQRYYKYVKNDNSMCFKSFGWQIGEDEAESEVLMKLYTCLTKSAINDFTIVRIRFNKNVLEENLYKNNEIESIYVMDFLHKHLYNRVKNDENKFKIWQLEDLITNIYFRNVVKSFMHGGTNDLVNSHLGLLKIWCDNSKILGNDEFLKNNDIISESTNILDKLNKVLREKSKPGFLQKEIFKIKYLINFILTMIGKIKEKDKKEILSSKIFQLFQFVSDYHEQIKG